MDKPEKLATGRDNQKWTNQRNATWRGNQKWTNQRNWQHKGAIKNGQTRETGNTGHI